MSALNEFLLFSPTRLGNLTLKNHITMAPMTRSRATADHIPTAVMATYYAERASTGLIITEGTSPSKNGSGYARIPGIYNSTQIEAWKPVTDGVHARDGRIFIQLMHTGRASQIANMEPGARVLAPSAIRLPGEIHTDSLGMQEYSVPQEMTLIEIEEAIEEFVQAARNAILAGFDGVEIHGANGYLVEQFIRPNSNLREDAFGGAIEGRGKFLLEIARRMGEAIGFDRVGVRLSPFGVFNDMAIYPEMQSDYVYLARELSRMGIVYLHLLDHSSMGTPPVPKDAKTAIREAFKGTIMAAGGYDADSAETELRAGRAQLVSIGRPFIANPDLVERLKSKKPLTPVDFTTLYTPGEKGYIDYPALPG